MAISGSPSPKATRLGVLLLMVASPSLAIDLPLKALVWEDAEGKVWVSYNSPEYLQRRHGIPEELRKNIAGAGVVLEKAIE